MVSFCDIPIVLYVSGSPVSKDVKGISGSCHQTELAEARAGRVPAHTLGNEQHHINFYTTSGLRSDLYVNCRTKFTRKEVFSTSQDGHLSRFTTQRLRKRRRRTQPRRARSSGRVRQASREPGQCTPALLITLQRRVPFCLKVLTIVFSAGGLKLSGILAELAANPSAEILDALRGLERKTTTVFTLLKASVYSIVLQQEIFGDEGQDGDDGGPRT